MQGSNRLLGMVGLGIAIILGITIIFGSWYTIDQGERGVILRWGAYVSTAEPGLGFKLPMIDEVQRISVHSNARRYTAEAYSRDQQPANLTISVNYHIIAADVEQVYAQYRSEEGLVTRLIDPRVLQEVKTIFGQFNAVTAIQERARLNIEALRAVQAAVKGPVVIESLQIENIDFSDAFCRFVQAHLPSVDRAEVLIAAFRNPGAPADTGSPANREALRAAGLLDEQLRYKPAGVELDAHVRTLAQAYEQRPVTLIRLIYALRDSRIRSFADAPERARTAVRKALKRAIKEVAAANPAVGRHLAARVETGAVCCYRLETVRIASE